MGLTRDSLKAAVAMPGGAPVGAPPKEPAPTENMLALPSSTTRAKKGTSRGVSSKPCKYGPRVDGKCPKKPKAPPKPKKTRAKAPCKYGPRDSQGRCPKKPREVRQLKSVDAASRQAGEVLRSKTATKSQKKEAVKVLGTAVAVESGKKVGESVYRQAKVAAKKAAKDPVVRTTAISVAKKAGKVAGTATAIGTVLVVGGAALTANRKREAKKFADAELKKTKAKMRLTDAQAATLWQQYYEFKLKQPVTNSTLGK